MSLYLTNKTILPAIHANKALWCNAPEYHDYHAIAVEPAPVTCRRTGATVTRQMPLGEDCLTPEYWNLMASVSGVDPQDLIIRVMTGSHIPPEHLADARRLFRPYKHFKMIDGRIVEVLRSHWIGSPETGYYSIDHARPSKEIAAMWYELADRISNKSNFRGYGYREDMVGDALLMLSQVGLQFDESRGKNVFSYWTTIIKNQFLQVLNRERKTRELRDTLLRSMGVDVED